MSTNLAMFKSVAGGVRRYFRKDPVPSNNREEIMFRQELEKTMEDWRHAENHFREATDQDLIDQAAYDLLSAKSRYAYLLKQARNRGLSL
ncbi:MAG: YaaL family protein [Firmicutes bacterium]|nr:YaaL family protein [Bacillota bacterium]